MNNLINSAEYFNKKPAYERHHYVDMILDEYMQQLELPKEKRLDLACIIDIESWRDEKIIEKFDEVF